MRCVEVVQGLAPSFCFFLFLFVIVHLYQIAKQCYEDELLQLRP